MTEIIAAGALLVSLMSYALLATGNPEGEAFVPLNARQASAAERTGEPIALSIAPATAPDRVRSARSEPAEHLMLTQIDTSLVCEKPRLLRRAPGTRYDRCDPLSDDVLRRYRSYAGELAALRQEKADSRPVIKA